MFTFFDIVSAKLTFLSVEKVLTDGRSEGYDWFIE